MNNYLDNNCRYHGKLQIQRIFGITQVDHFA